MEPLDQDGSLHLPQFITQSLVFTPSGYLAFQGTDLLFDLPDNIVDAQEVLASRGEFVFCQPLF